MENLDPPSPPNQGWENGAFLPFARLHPWFGGGGDGGLLFHFILSKIVAFLAPDSWGPINGPFWSPISLLNVKVPPPLLYPVSFSFFLKCALLAWLCIFLTFRDFHVHSEMFCRMRRWLTFHQLKSTVMHGNQLKSIVTSSAKRNRKRTTGRCSERN